MGREANVPPEWAAYGARFGRDGLLYLAEWRRGFTVHELRAMFFDCQQVRSLRHENERLARELERLAELAAQQEKLVSWYRRQLVAESRLGAMFARLTV